MANWMGFARTNYVRVDDLDGLKKSLAPFDIEIHQHNVDSNYFMLTSTDDSGGWPAEAPVETEPGIYADIGFFFEQHVMPFVAEGEVLIAQEIGNERMRYVSGVSEAYMRADGEIFNVNVNLNDIYKLAAKEFEVSEDQIARCQYAELPVRDNGAPRSTPKP